MTNETISIYLPTVQPGGAERVMINLSNGLAQRGYDIELVVGDLSGEFTEDIKEGVSIVNLDAPSPPVFNTLGAFVPLYEYFSDKDPAVIISSMNHVNIVLLTALRLSGGSSAAIITEHNDPVVLSEDSYLNTAIYRAAAVTYRWADEVVAVSKGVADGLSKMTSLDVEEIEVVFNPVISSEIAEKANKEPEHRWFNESNPVLLSVGRLSEQKNQELLLRAFEKVRNEVDARLILIGKGEKEDDLLDLAQDLGIQESVAILNWVDNPYAFMANANVFVLTSRWEGLPTVLIESLACGCSIVSADCPSGPREILDGGAFGTLIESYSEEDFKNAILEVINDPDEPDKLMERSQDFSKSKCVGKYESIINRHLHEPEE